MLLPSQHYIHLNDASTSFFQCKESNWNGGALRFRLSVFQPDIKKIMSVPNTTIPFKPVRQCNLQVRSQFILSYWLNKLVYYIFRFIAEIPTLGLFLNLHTCKKEFVVKGVRIVGLISSVWHSEKAFKPLIWTV